jgi:hypothetical protein
VSWQGEGRPPAEAGQAGRPGGDRRDQSRGQGRFIDPALGLLAGEGSQQRIATEREGYPTRTGLWTEVPSQAAPGGGAEPSYYGRPVLKEPVWIWTVPLYFYVGGTAGAAAVLAGAAQVTGGPALRPFVHRCRWVAAVGGAVSTGLLIADLGRPERFLHMLRVFRPTSAMSVGSWVLAGAAGTTAGAAILGGRRGLLGRLGDVIGLAAAGLGLPLAGYTAVLLASTAVPLWQESRESLPPLFVASAASGAASLLEILPDPPRGTAVVHRFNLLAKAADLTAMAAVERDTARIETVGKPLREGLGGALWKLAKAATAASLALSLLPGGSKRRRIAGGLLGTAGAIALRYAVFHAGKASARDPQATFRQQREGHGGREVTGRDAATGPQ